MGANLRDMYQRGETIVEKDRRASTAAAFEATKPSADGQTRSPSDGGSLPDAMVHRDHNTPMEKAE